MHYPLAGCILLFTCFTMSVFSGEPKKTPLADDFKKLEGKWKAADKGPMNKGTISILVTRKDGKVVEAKFDSKVVGVRALFVTLKFDLKEDAKKRWLDVGPGFAKISKDGDIAPVFEYRFDGDNLILKLLSGEFKDREQRFMKVPADK